MDTNYPGNSKTARKAAAGPAAPVDDKPKVEKIVTGKVIQQKVTVGRRISNFVFGDGSRNVLRYVAEEVLWPAAKTTVVDAITEGVERRVFGETVGRPGRSASSRGGGSGSFVSYNRYSNDPRGSRTMTRDEPQRPTMSSRARRNHEFDEIILSSRAEANEVLERMYDLLDKYQVVSVHDLYVMVDIVPDFTDEKWGWEDLQGSGIHRARNGAGYLLALPKPEPIA